MRDIIKTIHILEKDESEFTAEERRLVDAAKEATWRSYSPYSNFSVGAALLLANGEVVTGANQENCAYPSGLCAERTAVFYANARYPDVPVLALCIAARNSSGEFCEMPVAPCGACRQVLSETEERFHTSIKVLLYGTKGMYEIDSVRDLLPVNFDSSFLV